jgi:hypothetical protein
MTVFDQKLKTIATKSGAFRNLNGPLYLTILP